MSGFLIGCILGVLFLIYINNGNRGGGMHIPSGWIKNGNTMYKIRK